MIYDELLDGTIEEPYEDIPIEPDPTVDHATYGTTNGETWVRGYKDGQCVITYSGVSDIDAIELYNDDGKRVTPEPAPPEPHEVVLAYALGLEVELTPELLDLAMSTVPICTPKNGDKWRPGIRVEVGTELDHYGVTWVVLQRHITQADWRPELTPALFKRKQGKPKPGETLPWIAGEHVNVGDKRKYDGRTFVVIIAHQTQAGWTPPAVPALWEEVE